jgi:hypothetical protein
MKISHCLSMFDHIFYVWIIYSVLGKTCPKINHCLSDARSYFYVYRSCNQVLGKPVRKLAIAYQMLDHISMYIDHIIVLENLQKNCHSSYQCFFADLFPFSKFVLLPKTPKPLSISNSLIKYIYINERESEKITGS